MGADTAEVWPPERRGGKQAIPRPPRVRRGGAPPWAYLPAAERGGISLARVRQGMARRRDAEPAPRQVPDVPLGRGR